MKSWSGCSIRLGERQRKTIIGKRIETRSIIKTSPIINIESDNFVLLYQNKKYTQMDDIINSKTQQRQ